MPRIGVDLLAICRAIVLVLLGLGARRGLAHEPLTLEAGLWYTVTSLVAASN